MSPERLEPEDRTRVLAEIGALCARFPALLHDMRPTVLEGYRRPPDSPAECTFAQATTCLSADLKRTITPCQYGGNPECRECGCMASAGFTALARYRIGGAVPLGSIFAASRRVGGVVRRLRAAGE